MFLYSIPFFGQNTYSDTFSSVSYSNENGNTNFSTNLTESSDDNNSNGNYDFQEASAAPPITTQPSNTVICPGCSTTFTVVATNVTSYQWQIFNGVSWDDLTNTGVHSGTTSGTLVITIALPSDNGNQYRVILTNSSYVCSTTTSNTAT